MESRLSTHLDNVKYALILEKMTDKYIDGLLKTTGIKRQKISDEGYSKLEKELCNPEKFPGYKSLVHKFFNQIQSEKGTLFLDNFMIYISKQKV